MRVIQEFLQGKVDYSLTNLRVYLLENLLRFVWGLFTNNIDIKMRVYLLFNDFGHNWIIFIFLPYLFGYYRLWPWIVNYIPYFFFLSIVYIRLAHYDQFSNPQSFPRLLSLLDLLAIIVLFHQYINQIL